MISNEYRVIWRDSKFKIITGISVKQIEVGVDFSLMLINL